MLTCCLAEETKNGYIAAHGLGLLIKKQADEIVLDVGFLCQTAAYDPRMYYAF